MTDLSQSNTFEHRVAVSPNGRHRKVFIAECPRCGQVIDLKSHKVSDDITVLVFKAHRDWLYPCPPCPMADHTPEAAARWQAHTRQHLGLPEVANVA